MTLFRRSVYHAVFLAALLPCAIPARAASLTVSAASSLSNAFSELGKRYAAQHPGSTIAFNFGASGALLQQLARGAPVDVFAAADQDTMDRALQQGLVQPGAQRNFAHNSLVLVVPSDSNAALASLADLKQARIGRIAIGNPASVPAGRYSKQALEAAQLWQRVATKTIHTQNVRQALDYVARGEVDAGFVYATDAALMKDKVRLAFTVATDIALQYPIAPAAASANTVEARRFVDFVMSPAGQAVLRRYGFLQR